MTNTLHEDLEIVGDGIDHTSRLPDEILCKIFSYFDMKNVVRIRLVSKRWEELAPSKFPPIKLDLYQCFRRKCGCNNGKNYFSSFITFVNKLLNETLRDEPSVDSVFLSWCGYYGDDDDDEKQKKIDKENVDQFVGWINAVSKLNVRALTLGFLDELEFSLIRRGFTDIYHSLNGCVTLVELNLKAPEGKEDCINLRVPGEFNLPNLKSLFLSLFDVDASVSSLISGCPMLNELYFDRMMFSGKLIIRSPLLKIFVLKICFFKGIQVVEFNAPNIEALVCSFDCNIPVWVGADFKNLHSAYIDMDLDDYDDNNVVLYLSKLAAIVKSCSNATRLCLHLGSDPIHDLLTANVQVSMFRNLTWLGIMKIGSSGNEFEALARFLNNVPTIQTLKLSVSIHGYHMLGCYTRFESVLPAVPICLRKIEILNFGGEEDEVKLVEYLLKNGRGLQKVTIRYHHRCQNSIWERILAFPKNSETAQIIMTEYNGQTYGDKLLRQCLSLNDSYDKLVHVQSAGSSID